MPEDLTDRKKNPRQIASKIAAEVKKEVGKTASVETVAQVIMYYYTKNKNKLQEKN